MFIDKKNSMYLFEKKRASDKRKHGMDRGRSPVNRESIEVRNAELLKNRGAI